MELVTCELLCPQNGYYECRCRFDPRNSENIWLDCTYSGAFDPIDDERASAILNAFVPSATNEISPLTRLTMNANRMTRIPQEILLFNQLDTFEFDGNKIATVITSDSFNSLTGKLAYIDLSNNGLSHIEPGAFQGDLQILAQI
jgi:Leucine-rich repeat (LRR) protein